MKFESLSEAIKYYTNDSANTLANVSPYGILAAETNTIPTNSISFSQPITPNIITYGQTIWGFGKIINISKPLV
jgi:hypothetical protein